MVRERTVSAVNARLTQLALGHWPARALSAAGELGIYDLLASDGPLDAPSIGDRLGLRSPSLVDLLDALVGLGVLRSLSGGYALSAEVPDPDLLGSSDATALRAWAELPTVLRQGGRSGPSMFEELAGDTERLARFAEAMAAVSAPARAAIVELDLGDARHVCDLGGGDGRLAIDLALRHPEIRLTSFDLPAMAALAGDRVRTAGLRDRVMVLGGNFFVHPLPAADVVVLSLVLLDWDEPHKRQLVAAVADALPPGGRLVVADRSGDDSVQHEPRTTFELLRRLHLLVLLGEAHPFTPQELERWTEEAGFVAFRAEPIAGGLFLAVAERPTE
jgi:predicted O-methyltransferase YrrM